MRYVEPRFVFVRHRRIVIPRLELKRPITILHASDLHSSNLVSLRFIERALTKGLRHKPDLVCLTGDFVTCRVIDPKAYARVLSLCSAQAPTFAVTGNHDGGSWAGMHGGYPLPSAVCEVLDAAGIRCIDNENLNLEINGSILRLVGLGDWWSRDSQPDLAFHGIAVEENVPIVCLAHNPDCRDQVRDYPWDLMLCGHTHGGQLHFPIFGRPFAPISDHRYALGICDYHGRPIHVTSGVGMVVGVRFACPPEVCIITICGAEHA